MTLPSAITTQMKTIARPPTAAELRVTNAGAPDGESKDLDLIKTTVSTVATMNSKRDSECEQSVPNKKAKCHSSSKNGECVDSFRSVTTLDDDSASSTASSSSTPRSDCEQQIAVDSRWLPVVHKCRVTIGRLNDENGPSSGIRYGRKDSSYYLHGGGLFSIDIFDESDDEEECSETAVVTD